MNYLGAADFGLDSLSSESGRIVLCQAHVRGYRKSIFCRRRKLVLC